ncbi:MAG: hypothetical protein RDV41_07360 [Planctomycetota bacterium]|nr:hypothetical protein [Planctomycetota bacterium]
MSTQHEHACGQPLQGDRFDLSEWTQEQVKRTPWWAISVVFHLLAILVMSTLSMGEAGEAPIPPITVTIELPPPPPLKIENPIDDPRTDIPDERGEEDPDPTDAPDESPSKDPDDDSNVPGNGPNLDPCFGKDLQNEGAFDTLGLGGGAGGGGGRGSGRIKLGQGGDGGGTIVRVTINGLVWLARHQNPEGYWDSDGFHSQCKGTICDGPGYPDYNVGVTGLALLAFLGAGYTHRSEDIIDGIAFGKVVKKGLLWLQRQQDVEGLFGGKSCAKYMYNHALGTLTMCEAYWMTDSPLFQKSARLAVEYLMRAQTKYRGWRYDFQPQDNDMSVTGWCVMALKSAEMAGFNVGMAAYQGGLNLVNELTEDMYFRVGYQCREDAGTKVSELGKNDHYMNHNAMTAIGMLIKMYVEGNQDDPILNAQAKVLMQDLPEWNKTTFSNDYYYWYYATLALYMYDGPDTPGASHKYWKEWNRQLKSALVDTQKKKSDKCACGSWDADDRWGFEGGRVYATAINTLTLEVYYRYENVFRGNERSKTSK